jgi:hypothetical protein
MISSEERQQFVNKIKMQLEQCNYGFQIAKNNNYQGVSIDEAKNMKAIKELFIRLEIWKIKGTKDSGIIKYSEAKRRIDYVLDDDNINNCKINLMKF